MDDDDDNEEIGRGDPHPLRNSSLGKAATPRVVPGVSAQGTPRISF
jgi:hypothetical protein